MPASSARAREHVTLGRAPPPWNAPGTFNLLPEPEKGQALGEHGELRAAVLRLRAEGGVPYPADLRVEGGPGVGKTFGVMRSLAELTYGAEEPVHLWGACTTLEMLGGLKRTAETLGMVPRQLQLYTVARLVMKKDDVYSALGARTYYARNIRPFFDPGASAELLVELSEYRLMANLMVLGDVLFLDEISQLEPEFFDWLFELRRLCNARRAKQGSLRFIFLGNASQLPCMRTGADWKSVPAAAMMADDQPGRLFTSNKEVHGMFKVHLRVPIRFFVGELRRAGDEVEARDQGFLRARMKASTAEKLRWGVVDGEIRTGIFEAYKRWHAIEQGSAPAARARWAHLNRPPAEYPDDFEGPNAALLSLHASNEQSETAGVARLRHFHPGGVQPVTIVCPAERWDARGSRAVFSAEEYAPLARLVYMAGVIREHVLMRVGNGFASLIKFTDQDRNPKPYVRELVYVERIDVDPTATRTPAGEYYMPQRFRIVLVFVERENSPKVTLSHPGVGLMATGAYVKTVAPLARARDMGRDVPEVAVASIPLLLAGNSTIMQAQGRESPNVVLHLEKVGYWSQYFVAWSRATATEGLFLADPTLCFWCALSKTTRWQQHALNLLPRILRVHPEAIRDAAENGWLDKLDDATRNKVIRDADALLAEWESNASAARGPAAARGYLALPPPTVAGAAQLLARNQAPHATPTLSAGGAASSSRSPGGAMAHPATPASSSSAAFASPGGGSR